METKLNEKQFDVLVQMAESDKPFSQRQLKELTGHSLGAINTVIRELTDQGFIKNNKISSEGIKALEPYRARRALFVAAGFGSRLVPITLNTPKPLVRVNGKRIIDSLIDACLAIGINEIYIVRGYLGEQFDQLLQKYPTIQFLDNPDFNETNNISSAMQFRSMMQNSYVFDSDLLIYNPSVIKKYHYTSDCLGIYRDHSDDWCFTVKNGVIRGLNIGGVACFQEISISYWNAEDGKRLEEHIKLSYEMPGGKEKYWDQVPFSDFSEKYQVRIRPCTEKDVVEIDTFKELKAIDKSYDL